MAWKSIQEIQKYIDTSGFGPPIDRLYALRAFIESAVFPVDYAATPEWASIVAISDEAETLLNHQIALREEFDDATLRLAFLAVLFHHDLLVRPDTCDLTAIHSLLSNEVKSRRLRLPFRFGRLLYDKFNDNAHLECIDHLDAPDAITFLDDTPQGVYQIGDLVSGPLGLLNSSEVRWLPISSKLPLWHCSDTGCGMLHHVAIAQAQVPPVKAIKAIQRVAFDILGPTSEWKCAASAENGESVPPLR